jgi:hypothetical protein
MRDVGVDAGLQALAVEVVREVREAVRELDGVRDDHVRHGVARALGNDAFLDEHVLVAGVAQSGGHKRVRNLAEEGVVVVAPEQIPVREAHRRRERRPVAPAPRQRRSGNEEDGEKGRRRTHFDRSSLRSRDADRPRRLLKGDVVRSCLAIVGRAGLFSPGRRSKKRFLRLLERPQE